MNTRMKSINDRVNMLTVSGITLTDLDEVDAWLYALDMAETDRRAACCQIIADGSYSVSNIEHRVTLEFRR